MKEPEHAFRDKVVGSLERIEAKQDFQGAQLTALNATVPDLVQRISKIEGARGTVKMAVLSGIAFMGAVIAAIVTYVQQSD